MDFGTLLHAAQRNERNAKKEPVRCYRATFDPPKKEVRDPKALSANIQKFLARKEEEEKRKEIEAEKRRAELLALRSQDGKAKKRVAAMLKRTKAANKSVIDDAVDNDNTAVTLGGPAQPDEDDYGYVSQEATAFYAKLMDKYQAAPPEEPLFPQKPNKGVIKDLNSTKDRVRNALLKAEEEEMMPHKRKRKSKDKGGKKDDDGDETINYSTSDRRDLECDETEESSKREEPKKKQENKPPKPRRPAPPPMDFHELLKIAEQKQFEPVTKPEVVSKPKNEDEPDRPMTKKQKMEYLRELEARKRRQERDIARQKALDARMRGLESKPRQSKSDSGEERTSKIPKVKRDASASDSSDGGDLHGDRETHRFQKTSDNERKEERQRIPKIPAIERRDERLKIPKLSDRLDGGKMQRVSESERRIDKGRIPKLSDDERRYDERARISKQSDDRRYDERAKVSKLSDDDDRRYDERIRTSKYSDDDRRYNERERIRKLPNDDDERRYDERQYDERRYDERARFRKLSDDDDDQRRYDERARIRKLSDDERRHDERARMRKLSDDERRYDERERKRELSDDERRYDERGRKRELSDDERRYDERARKRDLSDDERRYDERARKRELSDDERRYVERTRKRELSDDERRYDERAIKRELSEEDEYDERSRIPKLSDDERRFNERARIPKLPNNERASERRDERPKIPKLSEREKRDDRSKVQKLLDTERKDDRPRIPKLSESERKEERSALIKNSENEKKEGRLNGGYSKIAGTADRMERKIGHGSLSQTTTAERQNSQVKLGRQSENFREDKESQNMKRESFSKSEGFSQPQHKIFKGSNSGLNSTGNSLNKSADTKKSADRSLEQAKQISSRPTAMVKGNSVEDKKNSSAIKNSGMSGKKLYESDDAKFQAKKGTTNDTDKSKRPENRKNDLDDLFGDADIIVRTGGNNSSKKPNFQRTTSDLERRNGEQKLLSKPAPSQKLSISPAGNKMQSKSSTMARPVSKEQLAAFKERKLNDAVKDRPSQQTPSKPSEALYQNSKLKPGQQSDVRSRQLPPPDKSKKLPPSEVKPKQFPPPDVRGSRQFPPSDVRGSRQFPPPDVRKPNPMNVKKKPKPAPVKRRIEDSDEDEYDSELDDFIDDGSDDAEDYSKHIKEIFGYDKSRYKNIDDEDDECMEANFAQVLKEEFVSTKIGILEDLEDMEKEQEEKRRKAMMKKRKIR